MLLTLLVLVALLALLGGALWQNICYNRTHYTAEFYQIHSRKLTQSCRVVFLTDLHLREYGADNCELVQDVRSLAPDLILLGGDFVTYGEGTDYDNMLSLFRQLSEIAPVCGVLGNHEDELYFLDNDRELVEKFTAAGVTVLRNQEARYTIHDNVISILGVEGSPADFSNYGASTFMDSVEPQTTTCASVWHTFPPTFPSIWKTIPLSWDWPGTPTAASCVCRRSVRFIPPRRAFCPTMPEAAIRLPTTPPSL